MHVSSSKSSVHPRRLDTVHARVRLGAGCRHQRVPPSFGLPCGRAPSRSLRGEAPAPSAGAIREDWIGERAALYASTARQPFRC